MAKRVFIATLMLVVLAGAACGGGAKSSATPTPSGPTISDEEYLRAICVGVTQFSDALVSKSSADEITKVVRDFSASMKKLTPPADLQKYNTDFTKYLDDAANDPTSLVTKKPPLPADSVRQRLAAKEMNVPECKAPTFFDAGAAGAASPSK
jgi:hypothetical protein